MGPSLRGDGDTTMEKHVSVWLELQWGRRSAATETLDFKGEENKMDASMGPSLRSDGDAERTARLKASMGPSLRSDGDARSSRARSRTSPRFNGAVAPQRRRPGEAWRLAHEVVGFNGAVAPQRR